MLTTSSLLIPGPRRGWRKALKASRIFGLAPKAPASRWGMPIEKMTSTPRSSESSARLITLSPPVLLARPPLPTPPSLPGPAAQAAPRPGGMCFGGKKNFPGGGPPGPQKKAPPPPFFPPFFPMGKKKKKKKKKKKNLTNPYPEEARPTGERGRVLVGCSPVTTPQFQKFGGHGPPHPGPKRR